MTIYELTSTGPQGCNLTPRKTMRTEAEIIRNRTSGMWLVEDGPGRYILRANGDGQNLRWRRMVSPHVTCPSCGLTMEELKGPTDNENLGVYLCQCCKKYAPQTAKVEEHLDMNQLVADLHQQYLRMRPKPASAAQKSLQGNGGNRITFSRETTETLRKMARTAPSDQRPGYSITMSVGSRADQLAALNRLGGCASDRDLRAEINRVRHYNNL